MSFRRIAGYNNITPKKTGAIKLRFSLLRWGFIRRAYEPFPQLYNMHFNKVNNVSYSQSMHLHNQGLFHLGKWAEKQVIRLNVSNFFSHGSYRLRNYSFNMVLNGTKHHVRSASGALHTSYSISNPAETICLAIFQDRGQAMGFDRRKTPAASFHIHKFKTSSSLCILVKLERISTCYLFPFKL